MADAISAATIAAVDRHLAHLGLYPRSDSAGLAPVPPPPPRRTGVVDPTTHSPALVRYSVATPSHLQYTFASLAPAAQSPPRRTGHHTLLRSRTVLCCGPCSLTVHFRGPRLCSSAPSDGRVLWTPPHTPPLPYSTLLHCSPWLRPLQRFSPPPLRRSGGKRQPLPRPISRLVSPMLHCSPRLRPPRVFTPPPFAPVAPCARNGHTTPRSYAELTQMRISTFKAGAFETKTLISTLKPSASKTKTLISTPKTTISTPEPIMPTSIYPQPRGFREIRLPCFIV